MLTELPTITAHGDVEGDEPTQRWGPYALTALYFAHDSIRMMRDPLQWECVPDPDQVGGFIMRAVFVFLEGGRLHAAAKPTPEGLVLDLRYERFNEVVPLDLEIMGRYGRVVLEWGFDELEPDRAGASTFDDTLPADCEARDRFIQNALLDVRRRVVERLLALALGRRLVMATDA